MSSEPSIRADQAVSSPSLEAFKEGLYNHLVGTLRRSLRQLMELDKMVVGVF